MPSLGAVKETMLKITFAHMLSFLFVVLVAFFGVAQWGQREIHSRQDIVVEAVSIRVGDLEKTTVKKDQYYRDQQRIDDQLKTIGSDIKEILKRLPK